MHRNGILQLTPYQVIKKKLRRRYLLRVLEAQAILAERNAVLTLEGRSK